MNALPLTRQSEAIAVAISISGSLQNKVRRAPFHLRQRGTCASTKICYGQIAARNNGQGLGRQSAQTIRIVDALRRVGSEWLTILAATLLLAACATPTVTRSCLTKQQYEQLKAAEPHHIHDKLTGDADKDTRPLAGSALELRSWGHAMLDTLKICSTTP